jgi:hypothetical protein
LQRNGQVPPPERTNSTIASGRHIRHCEHRHRGKNIGLPPVTTGHSLTSDLSRLQAVAVGGQTVHSFAGIGLAKESAAALAQRLGAAARDRWKACEVLVIDEVSMISGVHTTQTMPTTHSHPPFAHPPHRRVVYQAGSSGPTGTQPAHATFRGHTAGNPREEDGESVKGGDTSRVTDCMVCMHPRSSRETSCNCRPSAAMTRTGLFVSRRSAGARAYPTLSS